MKRSNYLIWFRRLAVLGAVVAGMTASAAGAVPMLDPQDTPANPVVGHTTPQGLRADGLRWQAIAKTYQQSRQAPVPDVFERYAATHPYVAAGVQTLQRRGVGDFQPVTPVLETPKVVASPTDGNGLDWGAFGIGAGAMLGLAVLVASLGVGTVAFRHRAGKLGTS
ncbi:MAG: hypothetical protein ACM3QU_05320 [Verrucomicrobiota bacterium]